MRLYKGRDCSVGTVTSHTLQGPGIESRWARDFPHSSKLDMDPTTPTGKWEPDLFTTANYPGPGFNRLQITTSGL